MTTTVPDIEGRDLSPNGVKVTREPLTYEYGNRDSFFVDLARSARGDADSAGAQYRLARHQHEMVVEKRTTPNTTLLTGGEFAPPLWAIDKFATASRAHRVLGDLVTQLVLPSGYSSVHIPRESTGGDVQPQPGQGAAATSVDQATADATSPVVTIAGDEDASQQLFDQTPAPGYDGIVYSDLTRAYDQTLDTQLFQGTGINGQLTGVTNVSGRNSDVSGSGANTIAIFWPLVGQIVAAVGNNRKLPPTAMLMAPRRWAWIASSLDNSNRPIASPGQGPRNSDFPVAGGYQPYGPINGLPVYVAGAIPALTNTDYIVVCRPDDMLLYESTPKFAAVPNPLSGTLQIRLQLRRYVAFVTRRGSSICVLTSLPQPTNF